MKYFLVLIVIMSSFVSCSKTSTNLNPNSLISISADQVTIQYDSKLLDNIDFIHIFVADDVQNSSRVETVQNIYSAVTGLEVINIRDSLIADVILDKNKYDEIIELMNENNQIALSSKIESDIYN